MTKNKLSIITPSYNTLQYLKKNILSVNNQNFKDYEHIIIDGKSDDGTIEFLNNINDNIRWISEKDNGQTHAINKGLKMSNGEIIGWLNSDDEYCPNIFSDVIKIFDSNKNIDIIHGDIFFIDEHSNIIGKSLGLDTKSYHNILTNNPINQPGIFFRKKLVKEIGYLNEELNYVMDREFWFRLLLNQKKFHYLSQPLAKFRLISGTKTFEENEKFRLEWIQILKNNIDNLKLNKQKFDEIINENYAQYFFSKANRKTTGAFNSFFYLIKSFILSKNYRNNLGFYMIFLKNIFGIKRNRYEKFKTK